MKKRADEIVHHRKLTESRNKAQALIMAGQVAWRPAGPLDADGKRLPSEAAWDAVKKPGQQLPSDCEVMLSVPARQDVGRGATKLRRAFQCWGDLGARGALALDVGASTGGFTQVLLEQGASKVVALDVGTHQLHERLRADPRVISVEQQHVLRVNEKLWEGLGVVPAFGLIVTDLSFISLTKILAAVEPWLAAGGNWILLVKPQFEVGPKKAPGGVVKNPDFHEEALNLVRASVEQLPRLIWMAVEPSPIEGGDGNREFLLWLQKKSL